MHPIVLIPLASAIGAGMLAAAIAVRDPGRPANRLMAAILLCAVWWSLCEVLWMTASDAQAAARLARWAAVATALLGPLAFHLLLQAMPEALHALRRLLPLSYALAAPLAIASIASPGVVPSAVHTSWGFAPVMGPLAPYSALLTSLTPVVALVLAARARLRDPNRDASAGRSIAFAIALSFVVSSFTEFALPFAGISFPRLGSTSVALWGLITWWTVYRFRGARLTPRQFAGEILAMLPDGVAMVRLDGQIRALNAKLAKLARRTPDQLLGRPLGELIVEPKGACAGSEREGELVTAAGTRVPVSLSDSWLHDEAGEPIGRVLVVRDVEELVSLRSRLLTSARLAAVGQLAAGIAHEINNPIAYVRSNVGLLERHWRGVAEAFESRAATPHVHTALVRSHELLRAAADGIDRVAAIVRDVGGFSFKGGSESELADPVDLLETAIRVAGPQLRRKADVERSFAKLPLVPCRPQELMQVFLNLVLAAIHEIEEHGLLRLSAGVEGTSIYVEIAVEGAGLAPEALERIFDPFSTLRDGLEVAGLGLALSRQMVERQGGRILVESQPGRGMRFRVSLPMAATPAVGGD